MDKEPKVSLQFVILVPHPAPTHHLFSYMPIFYQLPTLAQSNDKQLDHFSELDAPVLYLYCILNLIKNKFVHGDNIWGLLPHALILFLFTVSNKLTIAAHYMLACLKPVSIQRQSMKQPKEIIYSSFANRLASCSQYLSSKCLEA